MTPDPADAASHLCFLLFVSTQDCVFLEPPMTFPFELDDPDNAPVTTHLISHHVRLLWRYRFVHRALQEQERRLDLANVIPRASFFEQPGAPGGIVGSTGTQQKPFNIMALELVMESSWRA